MKTDSIIFAVHLLHSFGMIGRTEGDLLDRPVSEKKIDDAVRRIKQEADRAAERYREHHAKELSHDQTN